MMKQRASIDELTVEELSQVSGGLWEEAAVGAAAVIVTAVAAVAVAATGAAIAPVAAAAFAAGATVGCIAALVAP